jgi:hypothetical protein
MEALDAPNVCGSAYNMGTLTDPTGDQSVTGKITSASDVDCYYFYAADSPDTAYPSCDAFNVDIRFTANPSSQFQFTVYRANCSTVACSNEFDRYSWYTDFRSGSGTSAVGECFCTPTSRYDYNICNNNSAYYYFCVSRRSGFTPNCDAYTIRVTNGIF